RGAGGRTLELCRSRWWISPRTRSYAHDRGGVLHVALAADCLGLLSSDARAGTMASRPRCQRRTHDRGGHWRNRELSVDLRKLLAGLKREYLERVRTRWFVLVTVFGPIVFGALMYLPAYMAARSEASADVAKIRILDATGTDLGRRIAAELNGGLF